MANIINGTDTGSGGLITTGDSSDELQLQTAETARVTLTNTAVVVNEDGNDVDFRVEGDTDANLLFVDAGNDRVGVKTSSPAVAFDVVGQVRASTGILFGTDTAAANALDDYEEGTWTPVLSDGTNNATASIADGVYTKIGRAVYITFTINTSSLGSVSGNLQVNGLPFTNQAGQPTAIYSGGNQQLAITAGQYISGRINGNDNTVELWLTDSAAGMTRLQASEWSADGYSNFAGFYFV